MDYLMITIFLYISSENTYCTQKLIRAGMSQRFVDHAQCSTKIIFLIA